MSGVVYKYHLWPHDHKVSDFTGHFSMVLFGYVTFNDSVAKKKKFLPRVAFHFQKLLGL